MTDDKGKKKLFKYGIILFACAFILLFFTAYSQLKLNSNVNKYRSQVEKNNNEKSSSNLNLNEVLKLNSELSNELKSEKTELDKIKKEEETQSSSYQKSIKNYKLTIKSYDSLSKAEITYRNNDYLKCAVTLLEGCNKNIISQSAKQRYNYLMEKTCGPASIKLYFSGHIKFLNKNYKTAIEDFQLSLRLSPTEYISDDCYYFIASAAYKLKNTKLSKDSIDTLLKKYPYSSYRSDAKTMLKKVS